jgi:Animal haem peroxidase
MKITKTICLLLGAASSTAFAISPFDLPLVRSADLTPPSGTAGSSTAAFFPNEFRSIDGSGNNPIDPARGATNTPLLRLTIVSYEDGVGTPAGADEPSAREISNVVFAQDHFVPCATNVSDYVWQWGQFIDHDIDLTPAVSPVELFNIPVPLGDPDFDPNGTGTQVIELDRSLYQMINGVRQQLNTDTAFIDASQVYGSDEARALELRTLDGTGKLKTSEGDLLPYNIHGFPNAPDNSPGYFLAGDVRANEQVGLTAMHTLFMREHNYWAGVIKQRQPSLDDDGIYYQARAIVGAELQIITYRDFIPLLLGPNALALYDGYKPELDPTIANSFSTAAYRVGHTLLSPTLLRLDANNQSIGDLDLSQAFFNPIEISGPGIEPYLRGLAKQVPQEVDCYLVDGVRNFLFGPPGAGGFDLAALNIQRGRDHGLPRYNQARIDFGLVPKATFADITSDPLLQERLAAVYATPDDLDLWVGALAEDHVNGGLVGELVYTILKDQFTRLRDGDRFWYQSYLPRSLVRKLEKQTLAKIIRRNTPISVELQSDVFLVPNEQ